MKPVKFHLINFLFIFLMSAIVAEAQTIPSKPITGGFIDYESWMMKNGNFPDEKNGLDEKKWEQELDAFVAAGMDTIILKHLQIVDTSFIPEKGDGVDPTEIILQYADDYNRKNPNKTPLKVIVGLWTGDEETTWQYDDIVEADPTMLYNAKTYSKKIARQAWERYGHHGSFDGWYIGQEIWNINWNNEQINRMRKYFRQVSDFCKGLERNNKPNNKQVFISPYISFIPDAASDPSEIYSLLLLGSGIDVLMLQDSVGAKCLERDTPKRNINDVIPYFDAFQKAAQTAKVKYWSNVETFRFAGCNGNNIEPADFFRLEGQLKNIYQKKDGKMRFDKVITYDFFHFLSPVHEGEKCQARKKLFDDYINAFVKPAPVTIRCTN